MEKLAFKHGTNMMIKPMKIFQPLSNYSIEELLKLLVGRSVLWYGAGVFSALLLVRGSKSQANAIYIGILIAVIFLLLVAESMIVRKRIIPEVLRRYRDKEKQS